MKKVVLILVFGFFVIFGCGYRVRFLPKYNYKAKANTDPETRTMMMSIPMFTAGIPIAKWEKIKK